MRKGTRARVTLGVSTLLLAFVIGLTTAAATRTVRIASRLTIRSSGLTFSGRVASSNSACKVSRKVTLYRVPSLALGTTTTSSSGHWTITASGSAGITLGRFYAKVTRRSEGAAGTIFVCKEAKSKTIRYRP